MKRFVVLLVALILCASLLALPAFAASSVEVPLIWQMNSFWMAASGYGILDYGSYNITILDSEGNLIGYSVEPFILESYPISFDSLMFRSSLESDYEAGVVRLSVPKNGVTGAMSPVTFNGIPADFCISSSGEGVYAFFELIPDNSSDMSAIVSSDVLPDVISRLFQLITDNPLLSALCAASLILVCIPLFVDLKKSAR